MKILFIGNTRLGDAILSTSILNYYSDKEAYITVVCSPLSENIYKNFPYVDNIIAVKKKKRGKHWITVYRALERINWDLIIDLRNTIITRIIRKKKIIRLTAFNKSEHRVQSLCKLLDIDYIIPPSIPLNKQVFNKALKVISDKNIKLPILAIAPITNWSRKNWPIDNFITLINELVKETKNKVNFKSVILLGSNSEREQSEYIKSRIKNVLALNLCGCFEINMLLALLKQFKLFIGNDSGLMHLAAAAQIKTLGLFGPSKEINYRPWGKESFFLRTEKKYEDLVNIKGYSRFDKSSLMESLTVDKVLNKCIKILD